MKLRLTTSETKELLQKKAINVKRDKLTYLVSMNDNGDVTQILFNMYDGVKLADLEAKYEIHCVYKDNLYENDIKNTNFYITGDFRKCKDQDEEPLFADYEEAKAFYDKMVSINENLIEHNAVNTFTLLELIKINKSSKKVVETRKYE